MNLKNKVKVMMTAFAVLSILMPFQGADAAQQIKIKMVGTLPIGHHLTNALNMYKQYVEQKSNGRVVVELYPAQQLYNDKDLVTVLPKGAVDMAIANLDMFTGLAPAVGFFYMPLIFQNEDHFFRVAHGKAGDVVQEELMKVRLKGLGWIHYGTGDFIFKSPVSRLEDLRGKRVRAFGQMISYFQQAIGIAPTMMSSGEMYDALQKGTIDGAMSGITSFNSRKLYEVAKYVPDADIEPVVPFMTIVNLKFYNSLPADIQKILSDGAIEIEKYTRKAAKEDVMKARQVLLKNGVTFQKISNAELDRWRALAIPYMKSKFIQNYDAKKAEIMFASLEAEKQQAAAKPSAKKKRK
jgi:tripartite ATP-independent transporter DctP family solute receptor